MQVTMQVKRQGLKAGLMQGEKAGLKGSCEGDGQFLRLPGEVIQEGSFTINVVPEPRLDSTWMEPLILFNVSLTM